LVGVADAVLGVEHGAVFPDDAGVGVERVDIAVGKGVLDTVDRNGDRFQSRDEGDEIDVVASDIDKKVRLVGGASVHETRIAIPRFFVKAGLAELEFPELAGAVFFPGDPVFVVVALVIFHPDEKAALLLVNCSFNPDV